MQVNLLSSPKRLVGRPPCWPFDKYQSLPTEEEKRRLWGLVQGRPEWLAERHKRLGASSAACAIGLGVASPADYWKLRTGRIQRDLSEEARAIMERGLALEDEAARLYALLLMGDKSGDRLRSAGMVVHPTIPWIHASPDRIRDDGGLVEIKCPIHCLPLRIKDDYMCQVQQQMACMDAPWCDLFAYYKDDTAGRAMGAKAWRVWRSPSYWAVMLGRMGTFADCLMDDRQPALSSHPTMPPVRTQLVAEYDFEATESLFPVAAGA